MWMRRRAARQGGFRRRQGFGCLFALVFLLVAGSLVAAAAFILSQLGPVPGIIAALVRRRVPCSPSRAGCAAPARSSTRSSTRPDASRTATTRSRVAQPEDGFRSLRQLVAGFNTMAARLEADEASRRALLADVSHELRTPLTVIAGNLEAIIDGVYPADEAHLGPILDQTRLMERLIDDLRTLTLSEAGTLALHREPTALDLVIAETVRSFGAAATTAGVTLTDATTDDLPILDVDPVRIGEVLSNLVANALRHTPAGGSVTVTGSHSPDARLVTIRVADTGPGIAPSCSPTCSTGS